MRLSQNHGKLNCCWCSNKNRGFVLSALAMNFKAAGLSEYIIMGESSPLHSNSSREIPSTYMNQLLLFSSPDLPKFRIIFTNKYGLNKIP